MKSVTNRIFIFAILVSTLAIVFSGCQSKPANTSGASNSPTEAYKELYNAVKAKNTEQIKAAMTKGTQGLADMQAKRTNQTFEKVLENGLTATTFAPTMPEIRDERIKDNMGSVEVYNSKESKWEDLPFMIEDGKWKIAFGEMWGGTFKSPGRSRSMIEMEAKGNTAIPMSPNVNGNFSSGERPATSSDPKSNSATNSAK